MIQDQLVEYISSQIKAGVSRDTIKNTLTAAGWQSADVEDTLQKVDPSKTSQPITAAATTGMGTAPAQKIGAASIGAGPQNIKMSDLISTSDPATTTTSSSSTKTTGPSKSFTGGPRTVETKTTATSYTAKEFPAKSSKGALITEIILGILIIGIGALAGYLYFQNNNLNNQLSVIGGANSGNAVQLKALQQQLTASSSDWTSQFATLTGQNTELQTELSFYAAAPGTPAGVSSTVSVSGKLSGGGAIPYAITATYGAKVYVTNSKNASVTTEFAPLEASGTVATFNGFYIPGADNMTVTGINGNPL